MQKENLTLYWNRQPGKFVNKNTGCVLCVEINGSPLFTGTAQEWYETLVETIMDCRNQLRRMVGTDDAPVTVTVDPDTFVLLNASVLFRPSPKKKHAGRLCGDMDVIESRHVNRLTVKVEAVGRNQTTTGYVVILED